MNELAKDSSVAPSQLSCGHVHYPPVGSISPQAVVSARPARCSGCRGEQQRHHEQLLTYLLTFRWVSQVVQYYCAACAMAAYEVADSCTFIYRLERID